MLDFVESNKIYEDPQIDKNRWNIKTYVKRMSGKKSLWNQLNGASYLLSPEETKIDLVT